MKKGEKRAQVFSKKRETESFGVKGVAYIHIKYSSEVRIKPLKIMKNLQWYSMLLFVPFSSISSSSGVINQYGEEIGRFICLSVLIGSSEGRNKIQA